MRALVQRVSRASVEVDGVVAGAIERGFLVLVGVGAGDTEQQSTALAQKVASLRIFEDATGRMNRSLADVAGEILCVSQFTLYGDVRRGRRPSFSEAAPPADGERLYEHFCATLEGAGFRVERGVFGAHMNVELVNDGPVTLLVDTDDLAAPRRT